MWIYVAKNVKVDGIHCEIIDLTKFNLNILIK